MYAQANTWSKSSRYYWGFTERNDFDPNCSATDSQSLSSYVQMCRDPDLGTAQFGVGKSGAGWFCAQRRPGRSLGWLQTVYGRGGVRPPDALLVVDDDTVVDVAKVKEHLLQS